MTLRKSTRRVLTPEEAVKRLPPGVRRLPRDVATMDDYRDYFEWFTAHVNDATGNDEHAWVTSVAQATDCDFVSWLKTTIHTPEKETL